METRLINRMLWLLKKVITVLFFRRKERKEASLEKNIIRLRPSFGNELNSSRHFVGTQTVIHSDPQQGLDVVDNIFLMRHFSFFGILKYE
ncbi:MAG: hypothetical protein ACE5D0_09775 [Fidelibacterota bacterium]